jgi:hypothetical protein
MNLTDYDVVSFGCYRNVDRLRSGNHRRARPLALPLPARRRGS